MFRPLTIISLILCICTSVLYVHADDDRPKTFSRQMNELKRSNYYVYAEASALNEDDAIGACNELLKIEVTKYIGSLNNGDYNAKQRIVKDVTDYDCQYIKENRENFVRVFGYISKAKIESLVGASPAAKNPVNEAPKTSAPTKESVAAIDPDPVKEVAPAEVAETANTAPNLGQEPANASPSKTVEKPAPKSEPEVAQNVNTENRTTIVDVEALRPHNDEATPEAGPDDVDRPFNIGSLDLSKWQIDMLRSVAQKADFSRMRKALNKYKIQNKIKRLGDNSSYNSRNADTYIVIFDADGSPIVFGAPSDSSVHYDIYTGDNFDMNHYIGNKYIWFQISK